MKLMKMELVVALLLFFISFSYTRIAKDYLSKLVFYLFSLIIGLFVFLDGLVINYDILFRPLASEYIIISGGSTYAFMLLCLLSLVSVAEILILTTRKR